MRNVMGFFASALLLSVALPLHAAPALWQLPAGMEWRGKQKSCEVVGPGLPFFKGCYFGTPGVKENAGVAFFRVCGGEQPGFPSGKREDFPFLVVDFENGVFAYDKYVDGGEVIVRPFSDPEYGPVDPESFDPASFYTNTNRLNGQCWSREDPIPFGPQDPL